MRRWVLLSPAKLNLGMGNRGKLKYLLGRALNTGYEVLLWWAWCSASVSLPRVCPATLTQNLEQRCIFNVAD